MRKAQGPLLLEIDKVPGVDIGVELKFHEYDLSGGGKRRGIFIDNIIAASVADRYVYI